MLRNSTARARQSALVKVIEASTEGNVGATGLRKLHPRIIRSGFGGDATAPLAAASTGDGLDDLAIDDGGEGAALSLRTRVRTTYRVRGEVERARPMPTGIAREDCVCDGMIIGRRVQQVAAASYRRGREFAAVRTDSASSNYGGRRWRESIELPRKIPPAELLRQGPGCRYELSARRARRLRDRGARIWPAGSSWRGVRR